MESPVSRPVSSKPKCHVATQPVARVLRAFGQATQLERPTVRAHNGMRRMKRGDGNRPGSPERRPESRVGRGDPDANRERGRARPNRCANAGGVEGASGILSDRKLGTQ